MIEIQGTWNRAKVFTDDIDPVTWEQITALCSLPYLKKEKIRIMPDTHAGAGCTIGTTMTISDAVCPNMVGVDIGCGMETVWLAERTIDFAALDAWIRRAVPSGRNVHAGPHPWSAHAGIENLRCRKQIKAERAVRSIGTLGGGNHFIEIDRDREGRLYLVIHSGSRHLGQEVARYYQEEGYRALCGRSERDLAALIRRLKAEGRQHEIQPALTAAKKARRRDIDRDTAYVTGQLMEDYLHDMAITQRFALLNRQAMAAAIIEGMGIHAVKQMSTIHNYIDTETRILRKGAVSARRGEQLLIPINMRDGSILARGKGDPDWNESAPHGAGRLMSRRASFRTFDVDAFQKSMEGIYTTSVGKDTLDECPMAYKSMENILAHIHPAVEVEEILRPVYNFKASE